MELNRQAREFYELQITTSPPVASWEASFDGGLTWEVGEPLGGDTFRWKLAGPAIAIGDAVATIDTVCVPQVRASSNAEVIIREAPSIQVW